MSEIINTLYMKLTDINAKYCCLCYSYDEEAACCVQDFVIIGPNCDNDAKKSSHEEEVGIHYILQQILGSKVASLLSECDIICNKCIQLAITSFKFIKMCRENAESIADAVETFSITLECTEAMDKQEYKTMFIVMDLEESKCTQYYETEQFVGSSAALYKFQTLFRPFRKLLDNKGNPKYKCTKCKSVFRNQFNATTHFNVKHNECQKISLKDDIKTSISDDDDDDNNDICRDDDSDDGSPTYSVKPCNRDNVKHINELSHEVIIDCNGISKYKCKVCKLIYSSAQRAREHYKTKHSTEKDTSKTKAKKFTKPDYLTDFNYCKDNIKHLNELSHTVIKDSSGVTKYKCKECNSVLSNHYAARSHYLKFHVTKTKFEEDSDSNREESITKAESKIRNKDIYTCFKCNEKFDSKYILIWHLLNEHAAISTEFPKMTKEEINLLRNDMFSYIYTTVSVENDREKYCCKMCLRLFKNYENIRCHFSDSYIKPRDEEKEYVCSQCGKVLRTKHRLNIHEKRHADSKVICDMCKKEFKNKHYLKDHKCFKDERAKIKQSQRGDPQKEFICNECGKTFKTINNLRSHMKYHVARNVSCDLCPKLFRYRYELKYHQVTHTKEKKFSCNICGGVFVAKNALVYHTRIHTGERPYKCTYCEMRFLSTSRRADHIRRHHIAAKATCSICGITIKALGMPKHMKRHYNSSSKQEIESVSVVSKKGKRKSNNSVLL